ncbi:MAG: hypothetical protein ACRD3G_12055 [Vicinamibacterales bacterium]
MKKPPTPGVGDLWVKGAYRTVGWPAGRVTITDVVQLTNETRVHYHYIAGTEIGKPKQLEMRAFQRMFVFAQSHQSEQLQQPELEMATNTEAYRGEEDL